MAALKSPIAFIYALLWGGGFITALYLHGSGDIQYFPANALLILAGLTGLLPALKKGLSVPSALPAMMVLAFWGYLAFSLLWSTVPYDSTVAFVIFTTLPLTFFSITLSPNRTEIIKASALMAGAILSVLALWALYQHFVTGSDYGHRAHHPLLNPNNLAALFNLALLPVLTFLLYAEKKTQRIVLASLLLLLFGGLLATGSRGGLCAFIIAAAITAVFSGRHITGGHRKTVITALILSTLYIVFAFITPSSPSATPLQETASFTDRLALWQTGLTMLKDHLWTGTGLGTFYLYYQSYRLPDGDHSLGYYAHMDSLQFATETGITALLLFYGLLLCVLIYTIKALCALPESSAARPLIWASFSALLTLALHSHLTFNLYVISILVLGGLTLAAWYIFTLDALENGFSPLQNKMQKIMMAVFIVLFTATINLMAASAASGSFYFDQAISYKRGLDTENYLLALAQAEKWTPASFIRTETELVSYNLQVMKRSNSAQIDNNMFTESNILLDEAARWNPAWSHIDHLRAALYKEIGQDKKAEEYWLSALKKMPNSFEARRGLHEHYMAQGQVDKAVAVIEEATRYPVAKEHAAYYKGRLLAGRRLLDMRNRHILNKQFENKEP